MGIQGLLPLLKSILVPIHIKDLEGCSVAVDTYSWLHKGALSCSKDLCNGLPTSKHINYCMHRVNLLRHYGVKPIMVFDGGFLPMKGEQESKRARVRKESLSRAIEHESNGNHSAAYECYQKAVDISPSVAYDLIQVLKQEKVQYVVAPYEADAEMTFLALSKQVDAVITEDSDLIPFGCPRIIYKMDKYGQGVEFQFSMLQQNKELNFTGFTKQMVLEMCILSGCDYLQSLPGMGLKKAHALMKKFRSYDKVIKHLKFNTVAVPPLYEESFKKAIMTFLHQLVYDPDTEDLVHLSELPAGADEDIEFLVLPPKVAKGIARGDLDPFTQMPFQKECPSTELDYSHTNQLKNFKLEGQRKKLDLPAQRNLLTNYFCTASVEAKKSFRAPRITAIDPYLEDGSSSSCELGSSPVSPPVPLNSSVLLEENHVNKLMDDATTAKSSCLLESTSIGFHEKEDLTDGQGMQCAPFQHSICKPCIVLHKERATGLSKSKTITENGKVVVRSSYFLPKTGKENHLETEIDLDESAAGKCPPRVVPDEECLSANKGKMQSIFRKPTVRTSNFQQNSAEENDDSKKKTENRRVVVRSSYFQHHNSVNRNDQDVDDATAAEIHENMKPENSLSNDFYKGKSRKRKVTFNNDIETDTVRASNVLTDASPTDQLNPLCDEYGSTTEAKSEDGKFGSNISHLGQYCEIAEKSMERFVSVISSFKFTSNGSRASGLRPPLKDIRNASQNSSSTDMDLSKYAYQPTNKNPRSARRRT